jgi:hypothetical protein
MSMDVPFPSVWIGSKVLRSVVCSTTLMATSQVAAHIVLYLPLSRSLFKKPILDSAPSVHISVMYPKSGGSENLFSEWTGITKLLDPVMRPLDADEVDYNEADNEENPRSGCECLGRWEYHRGCACKFEPSSALHPCRLAADTTRSELHVSQIVLYPLSCMSRSHPRSCPIGCRPIHLVDALQS